MGATDDLEMLEVAKEECGRLERENAELRSVADRDERILAWDAVASHPFFRECYSTDGTLLDAMVEKLSAASKIQAERDGLLALLAKVTVELEDYRNDSDVGDAADYLLTILATTPAQSLAAHDAATWDEGWGALAHEEMRQRLEPTHPITRTNPYRKETNHE